MKYFKDTEFVMGKENVFSKMDADLLYKLDLLRGLVNRPLKLNSSYRNEKYNKAANGAKNSKHLTGNAVDIHCKDVILRAKIVKHALYLGMSCGVSNFFVHVDNRKGQIMFTY